MAALVPNGALAPSGDGLSPDDATLGQAAGLCPGERFADQPAAAFCSAVLVDWDLVLTAGHCVRVLGLDGFAVVFGYAYAAPGALSLAGAPDVRRPVEIVSEALDPAGASPRLDYAWLRLDRPVAFPRHPAPVHVRPPALAAGDPILFIGSDSGVPMKVDDGGEVRDPRATASDYFVADTDTSGGASGGGAFDDGLALTGILARGGPDYVTTAAGCQATVQAPDGSSANEQLTYAHRAVEGLCRDRPEASSLCRADCSDTCAALPRAADDGAAAGCAIAPRSPADSRGPLLAGVVAAPLVHERARGARAGGGEQAAGPATPRVVSRSTRCSSTSAWPTPAGWTCCRSCWRSPRCRTCWCWAARRRPTPRFAWPMPGSAGTSRTR
jgi:hypothetical protein